MSDIHKDAGNLQDRVRHEEMINDYNYQDEQIKTSIVHAREDVVLLVSYAQSIAQVSLTISKTLKFILVIQCIVSFYYVYLNS